MSGPRGTNHSMYQNEPSAGTHKNDRGTLSGAEVLHKPVTSVY